MNHEASAAIIRMKQSVSHLRIHAGEFFSGHYINKSLAAAGSMDLLFTVGSVEAHMVTEFGLNSIGQVFLYENPTASGGTAVDLNCHNRVFEKPHGCTLVHTPTVTLVGELIETKLIEGTGSGQAIGSSGSSRDEWILNPGEQYLIRLTNDAATTSRGWLDLSFYVDD